MGQSIVVEDHIVNGDVVMFSTDRSITGQDGVAFRSVDAARESDIFPGTLAERIFEADGGVDHVFVASNQVVVRRTSGWEDQTVAEISQVITDLFRFYNG